MRRDVVNPRSRSPVPAAIHAPPDLEGDEDEDDGLGVPRPADETSAQRSARNAEEPRTLDAR
jgi:hypothetical protein